MIEKLALPEIRELLDAGDLATLGAVLNGWLPADLAGVLDALDESEKVRVLRALDGPLASQVFEYLDLDDPGAAPRTSDRGRGGGPSSKGWRPTTARRCSKNCPREHADRLLALLSPEQRAVAESLLRYDPDSVGRLMTPDYVAVKKDWTVKHVLDHVRTHGKDSETLNVIYVVDDDHRLVDDLRIRSVLLAPLHQHVGDVARRPVHRAEGDRRQEGGRRRLPQVRPDGPARGRRAGALRRDRDDRRRARRGRGGGDPRDPEVRRPRGPRRALREHAAPGDGPEAGVVAGHPLFRRDADGDGDGPVRGRDRASSRSWRCSSR